MTIKSVAIIQHNDVDAKLTQLREAKHSYGWYPVDLQPGAHIFQLSIDQQVINLYMKLVRFAQGDTHAVFFSNVEL